MIDWWTLGVLLYEMLSGLPPFFDGMFYQLRLKSKLSNTLTENTDVMYQKILNDPLVFGDEISPQARSILTKLLDRDPTRRLGVNGADEIKSHPFFSQNIDFDKLLQKKIQPPFKPSVASPVDVSNFDTVFTAEPPTDSVVEGSQLSQTVQAQFAGTYLLMIHKLRRETDTQFAQASHTMAPTCLSAPRFLIARISDLFSHPFLTCSHLAP